jgi:putative DNA primase/helicase
VTLLTDLRDVFEDAARLSTTAILDKLHGIDSSPWSAWRNGKPLTGRGLASILRPFGIEPRITVSSGDGLRTSVY